MALKPREFARIQRVRKKAKEEMAEIEIKQVDPFIAEFDPMIPQTWKSILAENRVWDRLWDKGVASMSLYYGYAPGSIVVTREEALKMCVELQTALRSQVVVTWVAVEPDRINLAFNLS